MALALAGCAREEMPPGTAPDFEPPVVTEMFPEHGAAVPDLDEDAFVRFNEPLGDPRTLARTVETSPAWLYEIRAGRQNLRIRPRDGWRPGVVYTFRIPPGLSDLVRNRTLQPIEMLFATSPEIADTRTSGVVSDRETVRRLRDAAVLVIGADSVPYAAVTDTGGNFALRAIPAGDYWAFAFRDQNRNRALDREFEAHDSAAVQLSESNSVVRLDLWLTEPDSTPPRLGLVEAMDSVYLKLEFDDLLEPDVFPGQASVTVVREDTGESWPVAEFALGQLAPVVSPDSAAPAEESPDSARVPDPELEAPDGEGPEEVPTEVTERERPERIVALRVERALEEGSYRVSAAGFVNLRGLQGGGDTTFVFTPPEPLPEALEDDGDVEGAGEDGGELPDAPPIDEEEGAR